MNRAIPFALVAMFACKGEEPTPTAPAVDCTADEETATLQSVQAPDWPDGLQAAIETYRSLDGRWSAEACGEPIRVTINTRDTLDTDLRIVTNPLPADNLCGCTHDPDRPTDGELEIIARTTIDLAFLDYPEAGFSEENAGNVGTVPIAFYAPGSPQQMRSCAEVIVPPVLLLDHRDTQVTFRVGADGTPSGVVTLVGPDVADASCDLTNWTYLGDSGN